MDALAALAAIRRRIKMTGEELEKRMDELAREFAETHDKKVKAELEALSRQLASSPNH